MNTTQLHQNVSIFPAGHGHFKITISFRGKEYKCTTTNTMAIDRKDEEERTLNGYYTTQKAALQSLYNECKLKNNL